MNVIQFSDKSCEKFRRYFDSYLSNELLVETNHEQNRHLGTCDECRHLLDGMTRVRKATRDAVLGQDVPAGLAESVRSRLNVESRGSWFAPKMNPWMIAAAAGLLILVTGTVVLRNTVLLPGGAGNRIAATLSERALQIMRVGLIDHVHCTLNLGRWKNVVSMDEMKAASGRTAMGREFIDLVLLVQEKLGPAFKIIQGHRCRVNQREYIHLIITGQDGAILSLVITEKNGEGMSEAELKATLQASGVPIYRHSEQQLEIAGFETELFLAYVVSNMDREGNLNIASTLAPSVHSFLAKL